MKSDEEAPKSEMDNETKPPNKLALSSHHDKEKHEPDALAYGSSHELQAPRTSDATETRQVRGMAKQWDEEDRVAKNAAKQQRRVSHPFPEVPVREEEPVQDAPPPVNLQPRHRMTLSQEKRRHTYLQTGLKPGAYPDRIDEENPPVQNARTSDTKSSSEDDLEAPPRDLEQGENNNNNNNNNMLEGPLVEAFVVPDEQVVSHMPAPKQDTAAAAMVEGDFTDKAKGEEEEKGFKALLMQRNFLVLMLALVCCFVIGAVVVLVAVLVTQNNNGGSSSSAAVTATMAPTSATLVGNATVAPFTENPLPPVEAPPEEVPTEQGGEQDTPAITPVETAAPTPATAITSAPTTAATEEAEPNTEPEEDAQGEEQQQADTPEPTPEPTTPPPTPQPSIGATPKPTTPPPTPQPSVGATPNPTNAPTTRPPTPEPTLAPTTERPTVGPGPATAPLGTYEDYDWWELPLNVRQAAETMGHTQVSWNNDEELDIDSMAWNDLSTDVQQALTVFGWDETTWDNDGKTLAPTRAPTQTPATTPEPTPEPTTLAPISTPSPTTQAPLPDSSNNNNNKAEILFTVIYTKQADGTLQPTPEEQDAVDVALVEFFTDALEQDVDVANYEIVDSTQGTHPQGWEQEVTVEYQFEGSQLPPLQTVLDALGNADATNYLRNVVRPIGPTFATTRGIEFAFDVPVYG